MVEVIADFAAIEGLRIESPSDATVDGLASTVIPASVSGEQVLLEPVGVQADIPGGPALLTFVEVDGTTLIIRIHRWV